MRFWGSGIPTKRGNFHETFRYFFVAPFSVKLPGKRRFLRINNYMVLWTMNHPIVNILYSCLQRIINSYLDKLDRNSRKSFLVPKSVSVTFKTFWGRRVHNGSSESLPRIHFGIQFTKGLDFLTCCCCHWPSQFGATKISHWGKQPKKTLITSNQKNSGSGIPSYIFYLHIFIAWWLHGRIFLSLCGIFCFALSHG